MNTTETTETETKVLTIKIELGALKAAPEWESHQRGTNWCAIIAKDPQSPGGLARDFLEKAKGEYYYMTAKLAVGQPLEFAGDYTSGGGNRKRRRTYCVVLEKTDEKLVIEISETAAQAIKRAAAVKAALPAEPAPTSPASAFEALLAPLDVESLRSLISAASDRLAAATQTVEAAE